MEQNQDPFRAVSNPEEASAKTEAAPQGGGPSPEALPKLTLPKGGGAIRGIGESFRADAMTGVGTLTVPVYSSPGRSGFDPKLVLTYNSGSGNGPWGFGWSLSLPHITRKTDKGLPRYEDAEESDVFQLTGVEDLMPALSQSGADWIRDIVAARSLYGKTYSVHRYRPRLDSQFARIERWVSLADAGEVFWRSISKDNVTSWYGLSAETRIFDPAAPSHIFTWLLTYSHDDRGNVITYEYKPEDSAGVDLSQPSERNRTTLLRAANRYIKRIRYGNRAPYFPDLASEEPALLPIDWCFELVFDYGDHDSQNPVPQDTGLLWACRPDPFSSYRSRFEIRSYRLCRRVLLFHNFPADQNVGPDCLVCATGLTCTSVPPADPSQPFYSYLLSVTHTRYIREGAGYVSDVLPPLEFTYSEAIIDPTVRQADPESLRNLPVGLDGSSYRWADLDGEGVSGLLSEQAGAWFYKANLSPGNDTIVAGGEVTLPRFADLELVGKLPGDSSLGRQQLVDLSGDGRLDLIDFAGSSPGYYERTDDSGWRPFVPFSSMPVTDWSNPEHKLVDLTGDGLPDLLVDEGGTFTWYPSLAAQGFADGRHVLPAFDEEEGPKLVFADSTESIFLADMSGDGLTDLVRIRNGEICYWPNLGYGCFGAKVTMGGAPLFDRADIFDGRRLRLADIDGSGTTDILYLAGRSVDLYFNRSGNALGAPRRLDCFPAFDTLASIEALDLLGNGTACLVWSSLAPAATSRQLSYIDLMGGQKPHLLTQITNNFGAETLIGYAPSTKFYVADKLAGTPWVTRIPFPVQVVENVETQDAVGRNRFVTRYSYHHGYYDGVEREFRGFGRVDQCDTDEYAALRNSPAMPVANSDPQYDVPPILTKTWFHTGAYFGEACVSAAMAAEYYGESDPASGDPGLTLADRERMLLPDTVLPASILLPDGTSLPYALSPDERREACRALRGSILHQEIYALDGTGASGRPYSVSERNHTIEMLQPRGPNPYGTFFSHPRETIDFQYERRFYPIAGGAITDPGSATAWKADPRVSHTVTLAVDAWGNVLQSAAIAYGRRYRDPALGAADQAIQGTTLATCANTLFTNSIDIADAHRAPLASQSSSYELLQLATAATPGITNLIGFDALRAALAGLAAGAFDTPFEDANPAGLTPGQTYRRIISQARTYYRPDDMGEAAGDPRALLPLGTLEPLALPGCGYKLALTSGLLAAVYQRGGGALLPAPAAVLGSVAADGGGYVDLDGDGRWWVPASRCYYMAATPASPTEFGQARQSFFLPLRLEDPFGAASIVTYDADSLLLTRTEDAAGNVTSSVNDYRVLAPALVTDANLNETAIGFNGHGLVTAVAIMGKPGKPGQDLGDRLSGFAVDLAQPQIDDFYGASDPHSLAPALLGNATARFIYDVHRFYNSKLASPDDPASWLPCFAATIRRETHVAALAGGASLLQIDVAHCDGFGRAIQKKVQAEPHPGDVGAKLHWIADGWTIYNNKNKPVRHYEPFFSKLTAGQQFEFGVTVGVSPILCYDPPGRVVATVLPNQTYQKIVFDPWHRQNWDANDTVLESDPAADVDVGDFLERLPPADTTPTWYAQRIGGALGPQEQTAAARAAAHAGTPQTAYFDALGRAFLDAADNGAAGIYLTRLALDIQGNRRAVTDARGALAETNNYSLLGEVLHTAGMDAGARWMLTDVLSKGVRGWDDRGHNARTAYDLLRRPTGAYVLGTDAAQSDPRTLGSERLVEMLTYGEGVADDQDLNLRTRLYEQRDGAGIVLNAVTLPVTGEQLAFDVKGNSLASSRQFAQDATRLIDWSQPIPAMGEDVFISLTRYDALNRTLTSTAPDGSIVTPTYNERGTLKAIAVNLRRAAVATPFVTDIEYNAKGQRESIAFASAGTNTTYAYDPLTFRLVRLTTTRPSAPASQQTVQDLEYTYDPVGNITHIQDDADLQDTVFFRNTRVEPSTDFIYDSLYRLIEATGREQLGLNASSSRLPPAASSYNDFPRAGLVQPGDGKAMGIYDERYAYDAVGNLLSLAHRGTDPANPGWTRSYNYASTSLLDATQSGNRLTSTTISGSLPLNEPYGYDPHGNMIGMPQLQAMRWDYRDRLLMTRRQAVNAADADGLAHQGQQTFYSYDANGNRARKVTYSPAFVPLKQRFYLGDFEIYREVDSGGAVTLERQSLHIVAGANRIALVETTTIDSSVPSVTLPLATTRYQFSNHLGTACLELDENFAVLSYEEYYPFGSSAYQAGASIAEASLKRYRYNGKERDEESGLYYYGARYYASWLGRWTACDPIGLKDGPNLYAYVRNNPIARVDPMGTEGEATSIPSDWGQISQDIHRAAQDSARFMPELRPHIPIAPPAPIKAVLPTPHEVLPAGPAKIDLPPPAPPPQAAQPEEEVKTVDAPSSLYSSWTNSAQIQKDKIIDAEFTAQGTLGVGAGVQNQLSIRRGFDHHLELGVLGLVSPGATNTGQGGLTLHVGSEDLPDKGAANGLIVQGTLGNAANNSGKSVIAGGASGSYLRTWGGDKRPYEVDFNAGPSYSSSSNFGTGSVSNLLQVPILAEYTRFLDPAHANSVFIEGLVAPSASLTGLDRSNRLLGSREGGGVGFTHADDRSLLSVSAHGYVDPTNHGTGGSFFLMLTYVARFGPKDTN